MRYRQHKQSRCHVSEENSNKKPRHPSEIGIALSIFGQAEISGPTILTSAVKWLPQSRFAEAAATPARFALEPAPVGEEGSEGLRA
jgi:hypothetical protein